VVQNEAVAHQVQRLHIVYGVDQRLFDPEDERNRFGTARSFSGARMLDRCPSPARDAPGVRLRKKK
jgi:hypothetical protein